MSTTLLRIVSVAAFLAMSVSSSVSSSAAQAPEEVTFKDQIRQFVMKGDDTDKVDVSITLNGEGSSRKPVPSM